MRLLDVILGYDCNLACGYCTITPAMRRRALSTREVLREMKRARAAGYEAVSFTGGEPTIRSDLLGLIRAAKTLGFSDIKLQSNGLIFAEAANVRRAIEAGVRRFHVSIHAHEEARYERIVRREGSYPRMRLALEQLVAAGADLTADVILMEETYRDLPAALRWLAARGVRAADLWFVSLTDGNRDNLASMPTMSAVLPAVREALAFAREEGMRLRSLHLPRCLLGEDHHHAHDPGAQGVRVLTPDAVFDLSAAKLTPQRHVPACEGCPHRSLCPGLRPDYLERYGDAEIAAARGQAPSMAPTRLPVLSGP